MKDERCTMEKKSKMSAKDISLDRLVMSNSRQITKSVLAPLRMSIEEIGMLEPLLVYEEGETALIIDGNKRYLILLAAGIEYAPCILVSCPDTYTASRQVIDVSPLERAKMIRKALEKVAKERVAAAIGVLSLEPKLNDEFKDGLSPAIILAFEGGLLTKTALQELKHVTQKRQEVILKELSQKDRKQKGSEVKPVKPYNIDIIRGLVLLTPDAERVNRKRKSPWKTREDKTELITRKFREVKEQRDLMGRMYHNYVSDLVKQLTYIRGFLKDEKTKNYVRTKHPDLYKKIREIMDRE